MREVEKGNKNYFCVIKKGFQLFKAKAKEAAKSLKTKEVKLVGHAFGAGSVNLFCAK